MLAHLGIASSLLAPLVAGHGLLTYPPMRGGTSGSDENAFCPQCGNGNGVCGDGGQWGESSNILGITTGPWTMLTAGDIIEIVVQVTAHHKGHFEFGLCDKQVGPSTTDAQACFDARKLKRAPPPDDCVPNDARGDCQLVHEEYPERWYLPPGTGTYTMRFQLPSDVECVSCTLQWRWWTANSCVPAENYGCFFDRLNAAGWNAKEWCGEYCGSCDASLLQDSASSAGSRTRGCGEEFRNCADVEIRGRSGGTAPATPAPSPVPAPSPAPDSATPAPSPAPAPAQQEGSCVRNEDCVANAWCQDASYDAWCMAEGAEGGCPAPQCVRSGSSVAEPETTSSTTVAPAPEPETTAAPEPTPEPETTAAPAPTPEPETTAAPAPAPEPETTSSTSPAAVPASSSECVSRAALECINDYSSYWPKCSPDQAKSNVGPAGYEFGLYCDEAWTAALNDVLADPVVNKCADQDAIHRFLAQVAYETGYYSTVYQPLDGGAGLIHMIPGNWEINARDMDTLWPGYDYESKAASMGKDFFQTAAYGWRSVAAWFKRTNGVIGGCGEDLFDADYDRQTQCILSRVVDRSEAYGVVGRCLASFPAGGDAVTAPASTTPQPAATTSESGTTPTPTPAPTSGATPSPTPEPTPSVTTEAPTSATTAAPGAVSCVRNTDCGVNPWCAQASYTAWCAAEGAVGSCPSPQCKWGAEASMLSHGVSTGARHVVPRSKRHQRFLGTALMQRSRLLKRQAAVAAEEL